MKATCKKPTLADIMLYRALTPNWNIGIEPVLNPTYERRFKPNYFKPNSLMEKTIAPWDDLQVLRLRLRQLDDMQHRYTCPKGEYLEPTTNGWICPCCDYTQDWALKSDVERTYSQIGLKPLDRMYLNSETTELRDSVWKVLNIKDQTDDEHAAIKMVLERLVVYEPHLRGLFPWDKKKEG